MDGAIGTAETIEEASAEQHKILFGKTPRQTFQGLGADNGRYDWDLLPPQMQDVTAINEGLCARWLDQTDIQGQCPEEIHDEIVETVKDQTRKNKGFFGGLFGLP